MRNISQIILDFMKKELYTQIDATELNPFQAHETIIAQGYSKGKYSGRNLSGQDKYDYYYGVIHFAEQSSTWNEKTPLPWLNVRALNKILDRVNLNLMEKYILIMYIFRKNIASQIEKLPDDTAYEEQTFINKSRLLSGISSGEYEKTISAADVKKVKDATMMLREIILKEEKDPKYLDTIYEAYLKLGISPTLVELFRQNLFKECKIEEEYIPKKKATYKHFYTEEEIRFLRKNLFKYYNPRTMQLAGTIENEEMLYSLARDMKIIGYSKVEIDTLFRKYYLEVEKGNFLTRFNRTIQKYEMYADKCGYTEDLNILKEYVEEIKSANEEEIPYYQEIIIEYLTLISSKLPSTYQLEYGIINL